MKLFIFLNAVLNEDMRIITSFVIITILLSSIVTIAAPAAQATSGILTITKNTVLTADHYGNIIITADGITLNGNGHTVSGDGTGYGVLLDHRTGVTIKNLKVKNFDRGIYLYFSNDTIVTGNTFSNNEWYGIDLDRSSENTITRNTASNNQVGIALFPASNNNIVTSNTASSNRGVGIGLVSSGSNIFTGNTVSDNSEGRGIQLVHSSYNTLTGNTISNNKVGIEIIQSSFNKIYRNNLIDNPTQAWVGGYTARGNIFNLSTSIGGNYWSNYHTSAQGCVDTSPADGFCDNPFIFTGGKDYLPWTRMNGWVAPMIKDLVNQIKSLHLPTGTENELVSILNNAKKSFDKGNDGATINQLQAFINKVEAQSGKKIPEGDADTLIANSNAIIAQLKH